MSCEELRFKCPECGCEELTYKATVWVTGRNVRVNIDSETYGIDSLTSDSQEEDSSDINSYQCASCGFIIVNDDGYPIIVTADLAKWLIDHRVETGLTLASDYAERRKART